MIENCLEVPIIKTPGRKCLHKENYNYIYFVTVCFFSLAFFTNAQFNSTQVVSIKNKKKTNQKKNQTTEQNKYLI